MRFTPRSVALGLTLGLLLGRRRNERTVRQLTKVGQELGKLTADRWKQIDAASNRIEELNNTMVRLTRAVVVLTVAAVAVPVVIYLIDRN